MHLRLTQYRCRTSAYEVQRRTWTTLAPCQNESLTRNYRIPFLRISCVSFLGYALPLCLFIALSSYRKYRKILPRRMSVYSLKSYFPTTTDFCIPAWLKITESLLHRMPLCVAQYSCRTSECEVHRRTINVLNPALKQIRLPIIKKNSDEFQGLRNEANNDKPLALGAISRWKEADLSQTHVGKERSEVRGKDAMMS